MLKYDTEFGKEHEKRMEEYFQRRFDISLKAYNKAFSWANKHWNELLHKASGKEGTSIANQISYACRVSYSVGSDIARSIAMSR